MITVHLWPAPGRACPMPEKGGQLLPAEGAPVPLNAYWQRRINDEDALKTDPTPAVEEPDAPAPESPGQAGEDESADPAPKPKSVRRARA